VGATERGLGRNRVVEVGHKIEAVRAGLEAAQGLAERLAEGAADRHDLAD
jgi:hypothetical protein